MCSSRNRRKTGKGEDLEVRERRRHQERKENPSLRLDAMAQGWRVAIRTETEDRGLRRDVFKNK